MKQIIPRADLIAFAARRNGEPTSLGFVKWDDALRIMGPSITPTGDYPPRYAVQGFPTEEQLRDMRVE